MDSENLPDLSLERDILNKLNLSSEQHEGAEILLQAITSIKGYEEGLDDIHEDNFLPNKCIKTLDENQLTSLINMTSEFMSSYVIVGYDLSGSRVNYWSFPCQMSADASIKNMETAIELCKDMVEDGILNS